MKFKLTQYSYIYFFISFTNMVYFVPPILCIIVKIYIYIYDIIKHLKYNMVYGHSSTFQLIENH